jgi:hypothetical protein
VTLTMADGTSHTLSNRLVLRMFHSIQEPLTDQTYTEWPALEWFRDCVNARSTDGHLCDLIFCLVKGPNLMPVDSPAGEVSAA